MIRRDAPRRYFPPWGGWEGINQHGELAVVEQAKRVKQLTVDRDSCFRHNHRLCLFFVVLGVSISFATFVNIHQEEKYLRMNGNFVLLS